MQTHRYIQNRFIITYIYLFLSRLQIILIVNHFENSNVDNNSWGLGLPFFIIAEPESRKRLY